MAVYKDTIKVQSHGKTPTYIDVTPEVKRVIEESGIKSGLCAVISPHTTCSVFFDVEDGKLGVGVTGYVYFVDFDRTRPRERKCKIVVIGE